MSNDIIFYDLPSSGSRNSCWSLNPWKTRLALNYKSLKYTTQWIEYPDIKDTLSGFGIPPADVKQYQYTIPAIRLNGKYIMDSTKIASALEAAHPSPSLQLEHPIVAEVQGLVYKALKPLVPEVLPLIPKHVLSQGSVEYWVTTREKDFGQNLDTMRAEKGGQQCFDRAQAGLEETAALLKKEGGPFFLGKEPCYADFIWIGFVQFVKRASEEDFEKLVGVDDALRKQYDACAKYMEKDD